MSPASGRSEVILSYEDIGVPGQPTGPAIWGRSEVIAIPSCGITDTWTRTVASGWGTSDSTVAWTAIGGFADPFSVNGTQGVAAISGGSPSVGGGMYLDTRQTTTEGTFDIVLGPASSSANDYLNFGTGFSPDAYVGWLNSLGVLRVFRNDAGGGSYNDLAVAGLFGSWWSMRVRADAVGTYAKIWPQGTAEPGAWSVTVTPAGPTVITQTGINFQVGTVFGVNGFTVDRLDIIGVNRCTMGA